MTKLESRILRLMTAIPMWLLMGLGLSVLAVFAVIILYTTGGDAGADRYRMGPHLEPATPPPPSILLLKAAQSTQIFQTPPAGEVTLHLPHGPGNPRNCMGAFVTLAGGRVLLAYQHHTGEDWDDMSPAVVTGRISEDGGRTWAAQDRLLVANDAACNVGGPSLLRLDDGRIGLWYHRMQSLADCRLWMRTSADEGESWGEPVLCMPAPGYFVIANQRAVRLAGGRLMVPAAYHRTRLDDLSDPAAFDLRGIWMFFLSDDAGQTWREAADWWTLPRASVSGAHEPGVVELADGSIWSWARTSTGRQWQMRSEDGGERWSLPAPTHLRSPISPMAVATLPTGDLLAVWNDRDRRWGLPLPDLASRRTPLTCALSSDGARTWHSAQLIESDVTRAYSYPAIHVVGDAVLLAYGCSEDPSGLPEMCVRRVPIGWFYGLAE
ncbi:MAG TPA: sialidase family protein [Armatimonadota bacterium]|nr:sialidase family protein [Armatimonadota bacterium]